MDKKIKHRILGVMVIIGLVVLLFPLFQDNKDLPAQTVSVKTPPFPDQSTQVAAAPSEAEQAEQIAENPVPDNKVALQTDDLIMPPAPSATKAADASPQPAVAPVPMMGLPEELAKAKLLKQAAPAGKPTTHKVPAKTIQAKSKEPLNLKSATWAVQLGSFQNKANALRLVNQLRANGYHAFIEQAANTPSASTRVFVGPETKRSAAKLLVDQLEANLHLRGMVVSYKPLAL